MLRYFVQFLLLLLPACSGGTDPSPSPAEPGSRWLAAMAYDASRQKVVLIGGSKLTGNTATFYSDVWEFDGSTWSLLTENGPSARDGALVGFDPARQRVIVHGGRSPELQGGANALLSDTWEGTGGTFTRVATTGPTPLRAHFGGGFDASRGRLVLFGGGDPATTLRDTWEWDGQSWTQRSSTTPTQLGAPSMAAFSSQRNALLMLVGTFNSGPSEIWQWNGSAWSKIGDGPNGSMPMSVVATGPNDLLIFDGETGRTFHFDGTTTIEVAPAGPGQRFGPAMAYDPSRHVVVLFGGYRGNTTLADTWLWNGSAWTQVQ